MSLPQAVEDTVLTIEELAAGMRCVLSDPGLAAELQAPGLIRASAFTWERTARETVAVYRQVLDAAVARR